MKNFIVGGLFVLLIAGAVTVAQSAVVTTTEREALERMKPCLWVAGAAEEITATVAASDQSSQLNKNSRYGMYCLEQSYVEWGTTSAGTVAASGNILYSADQMYYFLTDDTTLFVAARNEAAAAADGSCFVLECK